MKRNNLDYLSHVNSDDSLFKNLTALQNEINVYFDTKVLAVTSINNDVLAAAFAKAFADAYGRNGSKTLIIDANLYNPSLESYIENHSDGDTIIAVEKNDTISGYNREADLAVNVKTISLDKQIYPGNAFKDKAVHKIIEENKNEYEHIIVLVPSVKEHKDVVLLSDVINSALLVVERNITKKEDIFNAIQFFNANQLPLAKTVVIK
ncbi:MAG: hypothetical protein J5666_08040 [Bacilli bacterium]|nr:hypothetical protein [Bacilli bacterium]